ncbi:MAG: hypothetical protein ICCCNLDF_00023 [Planctomycetes bacterium]|nr:hypothetical protein [Planctomycetota bacterium]
MLEFARERWLWLFLLVGVFYVAWWFARRYRKQRVTYGLIWQRVARRVVPPGWKRVLRTALTLLVSGVMLSAIVLKAAGLQRPAAEQPAPLLVFILLDNSPGMRAREGEQTRQQLAAQRAQQIVDAMGEHDRAMLLWKKDGRLLMGPWLKTGDVVGDPQPVDWLAPDPQLALLDVPPPPDLPAEPQPRRVSIRLGADDRLPAADFAESFGSAQANDAIVSCVYIPPTPGDGTAGAILFATRKGGAVTARELSTGTELEVLPNLESRPHVRRVVLPIQPEPLRVRIALAAPDALPEDDAITVTLDPPRLASVALCYPAADGEPNPILLDALRGLLPGREVTPVALPGGAVQTDLLVCDRVLPSDYDARFLLCFGVLPEADGIVDPPAGAEPNMQLRVQPPADAGFEVPELTLLSAREALPLREGHRLLPLAALLDGRTLIGVRHGANELLYCGFVPHQSTLLQEPPGLLLLMRWLNAVQAGPRQKLPLFVNAGQEAEFELEQPGTLKVRLADDAPWLPSYGPREYEISSGPDGRGKMGPFVIPGEYVISQDGREIGRLNAFADFTWPEVMPIDTGRVDLAKLFAPQAQPDWRDALPGLLLWIALGLMVLEWLLWLLGITE